jgi:hypothetical protein
VTQRQQTNNSTEQLPLLLPLPLPRPLAQIMKLLPLLLLPPALRLGWMLEGQGPG